MKKVLSYIRRRLSVRLSLWVVLFAAVIFNSALGFFVWQAREAVHQEAISRATQILDKTSLRVEGILNRVEVAKQMTEWLVLRHPDKADSMMVYSRGMLLNNPDFYNCSIAFEPYHFNNKGRYFSAYSKMDGDTIRTTQGGSDHYQYFYMDWYLMPQLLDRACWTEPYMDLDVATGTSEMVTSYCQSIKDRAGRVMGVINTSLSLNWLSQTISETKPYPNSYSIMIGRGGTYFVHPDTTKITRETIFTQTIERLRVGEQSSGMHPDTALTALGHAMQRGEEGMKRMEIDGTDCYVFYKPLGQTGCSMAIVCPESDIFGSFNRLRHIMWAIVAVGLLLMLVFFIRIITRELRPLGRLAKEAETIASGQLDAPLPDFGRTDEIGQLSHSFADMQQSLVRYIEQLKDTTAQKASIENELHIARAIQMAMLPKTFPPFPDCDEVTIYGQLTPAKAVGGDLYDFYIRDQKLFFCIGDVSGKGIPASLVMAVTRALFRTISAHEEQPERIVSSLSMSQSIGGSVGKNSKGTSKGIEAQFSFSESWEWSHTETREISDVDVINESRGNIAGWHLQFNNLPEFKFSESKGFKENNNQAARGTMEIHGSWLWYDKTGKDNQDRTPWVLCTWLEGRYQIQSWLSTEADLDKKNFSDGDKFIIQLPKMVNATAGQLKIKNDLPDGMTLSNVKVYTTDGTEVTEFENTVPNDGEQVLGAFNTKYQYIVTFKGSTRDGETSYYKYTLNPNIKLNHKALTTVYANSDFTAMTATDGTGAGYQDLFDRDPNTIWRTSVKKDGVWFVEFKSSRVILPKAYTLTTGAYTYSYPTERPKDWKLMAKRNATDDWTTISTVTDDTRLPNQSAQSARYNLSVNNQRWQYFRLEVSATQGSSWLNLGDLELEY